MATTQKKTQKSDLNQTKLAPTNKNNQSFKSRIAILIAGAVIFVLIASLLLAANYFSEFGNWVDAQFFQISFLVVVCFLITMVFYGFLEYSTASMEWSFGKWAIRTSGPIAGFLILFTVIFPNLTPTSRLTIYLRDGSSRTNSSGQEFQIPDGLEIVLQTDEGRMSQRIVADSQYGFLPKGVDLPVTVNSARWQLVGVDPETCSGKEQGYFFIKAGCRRVYLRIAPAKGATYTGVCDLPATGLGFSKPITLRNAIDALVQALESSAVERDNNASLQGPNWHKLGGDRADAVFPWPPLPSGAGTVTVAKGIERAFNSAHPDLMIDVIVRRDGIAVEQHDENRKPVDNCVF